MTAEMRMDMTNEEAIIDIRENIQPIVGGKSLDIAISAIEKQIPKKPINVEKHYYECPCCKQDLGVSDDDIFVYEIPIKKYCNNCGQALDFNSNRSDTE